MAFDCYCAICGVGFSGMRVEPTSQELLDLRRQWIERRSRALEVGQDVDLDCVEDSAIRNYDSRIVDAENLAWLSHAHCLGMEQVSGKSKPFLSGPGYYADGGEIAVRTGEWRRAYFTCYGVGTQDAPGPVVPFHWCCFEILLRALTGSPDPKHVDLTLLYDLMAGLSNSSSSALGLDYGEDVVRAQGQYWQCIPGAEYCVRHPTETPGLKEYVSAQLKANNKLYAPYPTFDLRGRQPQNPFGRLPVEIICQIASYLPGESIKALSQASMAVHLLTQDNHFWKRFIRVHVPWFWEFESTLEQGDDTHKDDLTQDEVQKKEQGEEPELNYKLVNLWLDKITAPTYGMEDAVLMGAANRRRIWSVCQQLAGKYSAETSRKMPR